MHFENKGNAVPGGARTSGIWGPVFLFLSSPLGFNKIFSTSSVPIKALGLSLVFLLFVVTSSKVYLDGFR